MATKKNRKIKSKSRNRKSRSRKSKRGGANSQGEMDTLSKLKMWNTILTTKVNDNRNSKILYPTCLSLQQAISVMFNNLKMYNNDYNKTDLIKPFNELQEKIPEVIPNKLVSSKDSIQDLNNIHEKLMLVFETKVAEYKSLPLVEEDTKYKDVPKLLIFTEPQATSQKVAIKFNTDMDALRNRKVSEEIIVLFQKKMNAYIDSIMDPETTDELTKARNNLSKIDENIKQINKTRVDKAKIIKLYIESKEILNKWISLHYNTNIVTKVGVVPFDVPLSWCYMKLLELSVLLNIEEHIVINTQLIHIQEYKAHTNDEIKDILIRQSEEVAKPSTILQSVSSLISFTNP